MSSTAGAEAQAVELAQGPIRYRDAGTAEPIVFVHGLLVDGRLWDGPAGRLSEGFRCLLPDWPMGSHKAGMNPDADLSPPGVARLIADFLAALDLDGVPIVGNDSGGATRTAGATPASSRPGMHKRHTLEAAQRFGELELCVLLAWALEGSFFKLADAERLRDAIPNAHLETIPDAKTFVPLDQPQRLAKLIGAFVREDSTLPSMSPTAGLVAPGRLHRPRSLGRGGRRRPRASSGDRPWR